MRVLLLNQTFHPDVVATAQYLTDLATALDRAGHGVTVLAGARGYDDPGRRFPSREEWNGIDIRRVPSLDFGKTTRWQRALGFGSYAVACFAKLAVLHRVDVVVALTSPPLISVLGAAFSKLRGARFVFWVMDLNPDEAVAAGWLRKGSVSERSLQRMLRYSIHAADGIVALDRYMRDIVVAKGAEPARVAIVPPWSQDEAVRFDPQARERFRHEHGLDGRFVVMYAGNHSPCNPLDTLVDAARRLRDRADLSFCFVGGGSVFRELGNAIRAEGLSNVTFIPYRPLDELAGVLSAADLHVATMGDRFVGLIHPSKIYNIVRVGSPLLYIGPATSHVTDAMATLEGRLQTWSVRQGDVGGATRAILEARQRGPEAERRPVISDFSRDSILPILLAHIVGESRPLPDTSVVPGATARS